MIEILTHVYRGLIIVGGMILGISITSGMLDPLGPVAAIIICAVKLVAK